jgi:cysteine synthase
MSPEVQDREVLNRSIQYARDQDILLPTFSQLADPGKIPDHILARLRDVPMDEPNSLNLFRIHWFNGEGKGEVLDHPQYIELPPELSGVPSRIVVVLGDGFPMIGAHKVLAAYACLVARLVTGGFDPTANKAVWPSTGNYCRGGIAISRILGCRGVAVLPEEMSRERFDWLESWTMRPQEDIVRTPGSESNVKEIYDACDAIASDPASVVLNQFSEFANYLCHRRVTGPSVGALYQAIANPGDRFHAFITGTGSAGTIAAGDYLKEQFGTRIVATEPVECPTMRTNGYGEHNIQGIGDKHIPLIHNVMNMDAVVGVSDSAADQMNLLFNTDAGRTFLARRTGVDASLLKRFARVGMSGLANIQSAIKLARHNDLGSNDVLVCVATDGARLYQSEQEPARQRYFAGEFGEAEAAEAYGRCLSGCEPAHVLEMTRVERERIFNLGYYTWVEQRGVSLPHFDARRQQSFWDDIANEADTWDDLIRGFNEETGVKGGG